MDVGNVTRSHQEGLPVKIKSVNFYIVNVAQKFWFWEGWLLGRWPTMQKIWWKIQCDVWIFYSACFYKTCYVWKFFYNFFVSNRSILIENDQVYKIENVGIMNICMYDEFKCTLIQVRFKPNMIKNLSSLEMLDPKILEWSFKKTCLRLE